MKASNKPLLATAYNRARTTTLEMEKIWQNQKIKSM